MKLAAPIDLGPFRMGPAHPLVLFAGPDTIESEAQTRRTIEICRDMSRKHGLPWILKCSFDKANRSRADGEPGIAGAYQRRSKRPSKLAARVHEIIESDSPAGADRGKG